MGNENFHPVKLISAPPGNSASSITCSKGNHCEGTHRCIADILLPVQRFCISSSH